ncbi:MAG: resolvase [Armatimonadetes bacterium CG_4_9_14_3_um_filter_66_14]|nr:MAG: resolvase [Armatimonadetes bacterium CG06_land_8_20_14_3_00_66_21]PJB60125.1 MAG: resolvase [Armatimonadetes bacterium CG_4_9_14_3_um_filter_66_14]
MERSRYWRRAASRCVLRRVGCTDRRRPGGQGDGGCADQLTGRRHPSGGCASGAGSLTCCSWPDASVEGISGSKADRPALTELLESLRKGDVVAVAKRDRLARDLFLTLWLEKECKRAGAKIVSAAGEGTEGDDPASVLMRQMVDAFAEYERAIIRQRTKAALGAKRRRGEKTGGDVPFGFEAHQEDGRLLLVPNLREQKVIRLVQELREEGMSFSGIAQDLNAAGYRTKRGADWTHKQVSRILEKAA